MFLIGARKISGTLIDPEIGMCEDCHSAIKPGEIEYYVGEHENKVGDNSKDAFGKKERICVVCYAKRKAEEKKDCIK